jgi:hypothetical protein
MKLTYENYMKLVDALYDVDYGCGCCSPGSSYVKSEIQEVLEEQLGISIETIEEAS